MFSGIIEQKVSCLSALEQGPNIIIHLARPSQFQDIKIGDSIACNGVCLTLESFTQESMQFCIGPETLKICSWSKEFLLSKVINVERSLALGDRIHGHFVSGHVDSMAKIERKELNPDSMLLGLRIETKNQVYVWHKGSVCINGVSLTLNLVKENYIELGIIPETLRRTNLADYNVGELLCFEPDYMARSFYHFWQNSQKEVLRS